MPSVRHEIAARLVKAHPGSSMISIDAARLLMRDFSRLFPMPDGVEATEVRIGGNLEGEWLSTAPEPLGNGPQGTGPLGTILYLHGGGYCLGSIDSHRSLAARLAAAAGCRALLVDYRLAPEHPFPAALDDARSAYDWLLRNGHQPRRLIVAGDSAGGGLTLAVLLSLKESGEPLPAGGLCFSPWTDLALTGSSATAGVIHDPMITREDAAMLAALYADGEDLENPLLSPLYADPSGLPRLLIQVGTRELLLDDALRFARSARDRGVDVTLETWPDLMHVWQIFAPMVPEAVEALADAGRWVRRTIAAQASPERVSA